MTAEEWAALSEDYVALVPNPLSTPTNPQNLIPAEIAAAP